MIARAGQALVAVSCALLATWLAWHYPLSPAWALAGAALLCTFTFLWPGHWPLWLLPLLPMVGLMTWSGWLVVEEFDIAVLSVAAGGWLRMVLGWPEGTRRLRSAGKVMVWLAPLVLSCVLSAWRGVNDAGGLEWGWWQGYREPLNSLRLAKPLFEVLLLLPLWLAASQGDDASTTRRLTLALQAVLSGVALWVLWERLAFTGLADFSSDYRATGPFWEMHVGGAGLDAVLAMTLIFAVAALALARAPAAWVSAAAVLALGLYAALATFSRIVYLAVPLGVALWWALRALQGRPGEAARALAAVLPWVLGFALLQMWAFPASGYRGMVALLAAVSLLLPLAAPLRRLTGAGWLTACGLALLAAALAAAVSAGVSKGPYFVTAAAWVLGASALWADHRHPEGWGSRLGFAAFMALLVGLVSVGVNWGGAKAWAPHLGAAAVLLAVLLAVTLGAGLQARPAWPAPWRWQAQLVGLLAAVGAVVAVFGGGAYMGQRLASSSQDGLDRQAHWARALALMSGSDWVLGKGLGRYWAVQVQTGRAEDQTGDYRLLPPGPGRDSHTVVLTSGLHDLGSAQAFKLSQRVALPASGHARLQMDVRAEMPVRVDATVSTKHLLYPSQGQGHQHAIEARQGEWQHVDLTFRGDKTLSPGPWYAPRLVVFDISLGRHANRIEIDNLRLTDAAGRALLTNGGFEEGLAHWYFTSDRYHMPWHLKNLFVHLLFEQGLLGLGAFLLVVGAALWRACFGAARQHRLAPALAASIVSLLTVGMVDSIMDMPRVAFLTLLLLTVTLALPRNGSTGKPAPGP